MNTDGYLSPIQDRSSFSTSLEAETSFETPRKDGLTAKLRQKINAAGKRVQTARHRRTSEPDLTNLTSQSQELILRAVDAIKNEDSVNIMNTLGESRIILKNLVDEFTEEQDEYKRQLEEITTRKEAAMLRRKENAIPLSILMRQKRDVEGLADLRPNSGMNTTYQAYFEALLTPDQNQQQHPSDKAAVIKYIRRRERRKRAEQNRKNNEVTGDVLVKQTAELIQKMTVMDVTLERERQRQNNLLHTKMTEKKSKTKNLMEAGEIIDQANEANLARQRVEQAHREKIEARLTAARHQQNRTPTNMIHVQSHLNENEEDKNSQLNEEQMETTKNSLQLLNENDGYKSARSTTPVYGDENSNEKIANIYI